MVETPSDIINAVWSNDPALIRALVKEGVSPDDVYQGVSALYWAADMALPEAAETLLEQGADPNWRSRTGETPLMRAAFAGTRRTIEKLLAFGANINAANEEGATPLQLAVRRSSGEVVAGLVSQGANVGALDSVGRDALYWAISWKNMGAIQILLSSAAPRDRKYHDGKHSLLMLALSSGSQDVVKLILDSGADPREVLEHEENLSYIKWQVGVEMLNFLEEYKGSTDAAGAN